MLLDKNVRTCMNCRTVNLKNIDIVKIIICLFFIADFLQQFVLTSGYILAFSFFKYVGAGLSILYWLSYRKIKAKTLLMEGVLGLLLLYTSVVSHNFSYFIIFCMIIISKKYTIEEYIAFTSKCIVTEIFIAFCLWAISTIVDIGIPFFYNVAEKRVSFGLGHPNLLAMKVIWVTFAYLLLSNKRDIQKRILVCFMIQSLFAFLTDSATFIFGLLSIILYSLKQNRAVSACLNNIAKWIFPLTSGFIYTVAYYHNYGTNSFLVQLSSVVDYLSNFRISMAALAIRQNGLTFLGDVVNYEHKWDELYRFGNFTIDTLYVYFFVSIGIFYLFAISYMFWKLSKYKNVDISLSIILFALSGLAELSVIYITTCFVLSYLKIFIFKDEDPRRLFSGRYLLNEVH